MATQIREATTVLEATTIKNKPGRLLIGIISPGQGSSGYYAPEVLETAAVDKVFPAGTQMHFDHPTESDKSERPERSVLTVGAVLKEDARWDAELQKLVGEAAILDGPYKGLLEDETFQSAIGVSIRASAEVSEGEVDGHRTTIIDRLIESVSNSVDFVTHAGRGGSILSVLESARPASVNARAITNGVEEATVNDQREALSNVLREAYNADNTWVWLRDFDETTAWFDIEDNDGSATWQQTYTTGDGGLVDALTGERTQVRAITQYVPAIPAGHATTEESKEDTMATTQIEESALAELRETAGRVAALETERDTEKAGRETAESERDALSRGIRIDAIIGESDTVFDALQTAGLRALAPVNEGVLDEEAFKTVIAAEAAKVAEADGAGSVTGFGGASKSDGTVSEADFDATFNTSKEA